MIIQDWNHSTKDQRVKKVDWLASTNRRVKERERERKTKQFEMDAIQRYFQSDIRNVGQQNLGNEQVSNNDFMHGQFVFMCMNMAEY